MNNPYHILYVQRDDGGCGFFRCHQPADFLNRAGLAVAVSTLEKPTREQLLGADLVIVQESGSMDAANMINFMVEKKIPFMTEYDDFIHHVSPRNLGGYPAWNPATLMLHRSMEATKKASGVTVSTPQLAREYFPYNPVIYVIPNYLDKERWDNPVVKRNDGKIRIGWCGGNAHADDLKMISGVIDKLVKEYKGNVVFETMGMTRQELTGVFPMKIQNEACVSCGYEGELHHFPGEGQNDYPIALASRGWDIAVAPVIDNSFGNCKSDLKLKEYAACGVPTVASRVAPYREAKEDGAEVILATTFDEWYNALKELIESKEKRDEMARKNKEWVERYWIQDNIGNIFEAYRQLIVGTQSTLGTRETRMKNDGMV